MQIISQLRAFAPVVPLPECCSHPHFPPTFASHFTCSVKPSSLPQTEPAVSAFSHRPDTTAHLPLMTGLTLGRRERLLVRKLVAESLCGRLSATMVPTILPALITPAAPPSRRGIYCPAVPPRETVSITECDNVPVPSQKILLPVTR